MEIVTAPSPPATSEWGRWLVVLGIFAPVTLLALLPIGFGLQRYVVAGDEMAPDIGRGSVVLVREVPVSDLRAGDVIAFRPPPYAATDGPVTRRIVSIQSGWAQTRADSRTALDPWTVQLDQPTEQRVVAALPYVGYVYLLLGVPGPLAVAGVAGLGVAALAVAIVLGRGRPRPRV